jgi:hypothetical protein
LVHNIFELHNAIALKAINAVDQKVQQIMKNYDLLKPGNHEIEELYQKENIAGQLTPGNASPELLERLKNLENVIVKKVSEAVPKLELEARIDRQDRFAAACQTPAVLEGIDFSILESILKEGPVDFAAISMPINANNPSMGTHSLLSHVLNYKKAPDDSLLKFLLEHGVKVNSQDQKEAEDVMNYWFPSPDLPRGSGHSYGDGTLLRAFLKAGLDINLSLSGDKWYLKYLRYTTLLFRASRDRNYRVTADLIFYGAGELDDGLADTGGGYNDLKPKLRLRDEVLEKMQKHVPLKERKSHKDLSVSERFHLFQLCHDTKKFRENFIRGKEDKETAERIAIHKAFFSACLEGKFEEAEKLLLSQDIDINASLIPHPRAKDTYDKIYYPLLNHACMLGDVKLVEFLLKHGAKCNLGEDRWEARWWPPILECAIYNTPNLHEIRELLLKAGANPNEKSGGQYWVGQIHFRQALEMGVDKRTMLENLTLAGMDIDLQDICYAGKPTLLDHAIPDMDCRDITYRKHNEELAQLLIYFGARIRDEDLKQIQEKAIKVRDQAMNEILNEHLKELDDLKPLSMDLINIIGGYHNDIKLTSQQRLDLAHRCFSLQI